MARDEAAKGPERQGVLIMGEASVAPSGSPAARRVRLVQRSLRFGPLRRAQRTAAPRPNQSTKGATDVRSWAGRDAQHCDENVCPRAWNPRVRAAMMEWGSARQTKGLASVSLCSATKRLMAACSSATEQKTPLLSRRRESLAKKPSTAFSQELDVGVKWKLQRGCPVHP